MPTIRQRYQELYERLKRPGLDDLLAHDSLSDGQRNAIREIARLPHPNDVSLGQIDTICQQCTSEMLEYVYPVHGIGDLANSILRQLEAAGDRPPVDDGQPWNVPPTPPRPRDGYTADEVVLMLQDTNTMLFSALNLLGSINQKTDYTLKSVCSEYGCDGDLEVYIDTSGSQPELRLRCKDCFNGGAPSGKSWHVADLK